MREVTPRQREALERIRVWIEERRRPPTVRELCEDLEVSSTYSVVCLLTSLEEKGCITRGADGQARQLQITVKGWRELGRVVCAECGGAGHVLARGAA